MKSPTKEIDVVLLEESLRGVGLRAYADRRNATIMLHVYDNTSGSAQVASISPAMIAQWDDISDFVTQCIEVLTPPRRFDKSHVEKPIISEVGDRFPKMKTQE